MSVIVPDIRPCLVCGEGVLCDEDYPPLIVVVCMPCIRERIEDFDERERKEQND